MKEKELFEKKGEDMRGIAQHLPMGVMRSEFRKEDFHAINYHWHDEFQFFVITGGSFLFRIGNKDFYLKEGQGIFINSGQIHKVQAQEVGASYVFIYFHPDMFGREDGYLRRRFVDPLLRRIAAYEIRDDAIKESIRTAYDLAQSGDVFFELALISRIFSIYHKHCNYMDRCQAVCMPDGTLRDRMRRVIIYIEKNFREDLRLEDIAADIGLSRSECSRLFKAHFGQNLFDYILEYRLDKSIEDLIHSDRPIVEVAFRSGFNSPSYYIRKFKERYDTTPLKIRQKHIDDREIYERKS